MNTSEWVQRAACRKMDPELFFPESGMNVDVSEAKAACAGCPVSEECHQYAMAMGERDGIWGGRSSLDRRRLRSRKARV